MSGGECWTVLMLLLVSADIDGADVDVVVTVDEWC